MKADRRCPRCQEGMLRVWDELSDEEREVVKRLPASAEYAAAERQRMHQWCSRCWSETTARDADVT